MATTDQSVALRMATGGSGRSRATVPTCCWRLCQGLGGGCGCHPCCAYAGLLGGSGTASPESGTLGAPELPGDSDGTASTDGSGDFEVSGGGDGSCGRDGSGASGFRDDSDV